MNPHPPHPHPLTPADLPPGTWANADDVTDLYEIGHQTLTAL
ncbi:hypothetical protein [Streptomyces sp. KL2]